MSVLVQFAKPQNGYYYPTPAILDSIEEPALLCPLNAIGKSNPRAHIRFGVRGIVAPVDKSERGSASIELLRLREEDLRQDRQQAQEDFADRFYDAMRRFDVERPQEAEAAKLIDKYVQGQYPFSAAALDCHPILAKAQMALMPSAPNPRSVAAINFLAHVDAIILDFRENGCGDPKMVAMISSYLFDKPTHLNDLYNRKEDFAQRYWTLPYVPGTMFADQPAFVLTSKSSKKS